jgi:hypothetical protein
MDKRIERSYNPRLASDPNAWWYLQRKDFVSFNDKKQRRWTHIAALLFEPDQAVAARQPCGPCAAAGETCRLYSVGNKHEFGKQAPLACARCQRSGHSCDAVAPSAANEVVLLPLGACEGCSEKDEVIADLREQVKRLERRLARLEGSG